jgi:hypothetical protein
VEDDPTTAERYEVYVRVADDDDQCLYMVEHWFADRPGDETLGMLLEEAKRTFAFLYPDADAVDYAVEVTRLRPGDKGRPPRPG